MATFEVKLYPITIERHPDADLLELAVIGDYRAVVARGQYSTGDMVAYIPEGAVVPDWLISKLGLTGRLAGSKKNRVKAIKLRGVLSQGLVYPCDKMFLHAHDTDDNTDGTFVWTICGEDPDEWMFIDDNDDGDWAEFLGIVKYEPPIPIHMAGEVQNIHGYTLSYDIENLKKFPEVLVDGEDVIITEKLHGTWACWGWNPNCGLVVTSKGLSKQGLSFKDEHVNDGNLYMKTLRATQDDEGRTALHRVCEDFAAVGEAVYLLGEIFGGNVQDLKYGMDKPVFRLFDVYIGEPGHGYYADFDMLVKIAAVADLPLVPLLYRGPYSKAKVLELTDGRETVSGKEACIREGVVVRTSTERKDPVIGRMQLKSVSEKYLLRKGGTEFN